MKTFLKDIYRSIGRFINPKEDDFYYYAMKIVDVMKEEIFKHFGVPMDDVKIEFDTEDCGKILGVYRCTVVKTVANCYSTNDGYIGISSSTANPDKKEISIIPPKKEKVLDIKVIERRIILFLKVHYNSYKYDLNVFMEKVLETLSHEVFHIYQQNRDVIEFDKHSSTSDADDDMYENNPIEIEANYKSKLFMLEKFKRIEKSINRIRARDFAVYISLWALLNFILFNIILYFI
jgi:hypothetical protein